MSPHCLLKDPQISGLGGQYEAPSQQSYALSLTALPHTGNSSFLFSYDLLGITYFTIVSWIACKSISFTNCEILYSMNVMYVFPAPSAVSDTWENNFFS